MTQQQSFNPNNHLMKIGYKDKAKDYLPVQWRLVWFRELCPQGTIDTEELEYDLDREVQSEESVWNNEKKRMEKVIKTSKGYARYRAIVTDGKGGRATGTKSENAASFPDFGEKAETGAIGRALAALGYGTQFTGDEFEEHSRIVDSPVERSMPAETNSANGASITVDSLKLLCDEVVGPNKWTSVRSRLIKPEEVGDIPDELLSAAQLGQIHEALLERQKNKAKMAQKAS